MLTEPEYGTPKKGLLQMNPAGVSGTRMECRTHRQRLFCSSPLYLPFTQYRFSLHIQASPDLQ